MTIFNQTTVVGLFDNDKDVDQAVSALQKQGFGVENDDEINILDRNRLPQESPLENSGKEGIVPPVPASGRTGGVVPSTPPAPQDSTAAINKVANMLVKKGVGSEEAEFYARRVAKGSRLVIVETDRERAPQALNVMNETNVKPMAS